MIEYNELLVEQLEGETDTGKEKLRKINEYFLNLSKPNIYHPYNKANHVKTQDSLFESMCFLLEEKGVSDPGNLSLFQFISRIKRIEDQIEASKK